MQLTTAPLHSHDRRPRRRSILALSILAIVATGALVPPPAARAAGPAPNPRVAALEHDFLMGMVPHHRSAIMMAELAREKATQPALRDFAERIIADQQREIVLMTAQLQDWYGMEPPTGMQMPHDIMMRMDRAMLHGMMPDMDQQMTELMTLTGAGIDIAFMTSMIGHHAMAVLMAAPVLMAGYHHELRDLAVRIVTSQGEEIDQLQEWLATWYGVEHPMEPEAPAPGGGHTDHTAK